MCCVNVQTVLFIFTAKMNASFNIVPQSEEYVPFKATSASAGWDLRSNMTVEIEKGQFQKVTTGVRVQLPVGTYGRIAAKSSLTLRWGYVIMGGVVDADYTGEVVVLIYAATQTIKIRKQDIIAQLIVEKIWNFRANVIFDKFFEINPFLDATERGNMLFGSATARYLSAHRPYFEHEITHRVGDPPRDRLGSGSQEAVIGLPPPRLQRESHGSRERVESRERHGSRGRLESRNRDERRYNDDRCHGSRRREPRTSSYESDRSCRDRDNRKQRSSSREKKRPEKTSDKLGDPSDGQGNRVTLLPRTPNTSINNCPLTPSYDRAKDGLIDTPYDPEFPHYESTPAMTQDPSPLSKASVADRAHDPLISDEDQQDQLLNHLLNI